MTYRTLFPRMLIWSRLTGGFPFGVTLTRRMCVFIAMSTPAGKSPPFDQSLPSVLVQDVRTSRFRLTRYRPVDGGPIFQLDGDRLVGKLHEKPVFLFRGARGTSSATVHELASRCRPTGTLAPFPRHERVALPSSLSWAPSSRILEPCLGSNVRDALDEFHGELRRRVPARFLPFCSHLRVRPRLFRSAERNP